MPKEVPIAVFRTAHTVVDRDEVARWLKFIGADEFVLPEDDEISDPALLIALAAKRCYMSFQTSLNPNLTRIRKEYVDYFDNILKSGHGSVLEHSVYTFAVENISRVFTAEMNRHRAGWAISEGSLRFIRFGDCIRFWMPDSIKAEPGEKPIFNVPSHQAYQAKQAAMLRTSHPSQLAETRDNLQIILDSLDADKRLRAKKELSRQVFMSAFSDQEAWYRALEVIWADELAPDSKFHAKKQITSMMRRIIGLGVATGGTWTGNIRAIRHVMAMRSSPAAEEEMIHVFSRITKVMAEKEPLLFGDFHQDEQGFWRPKYVKV